MLQAIELPQLYTVLSMLERAYRAGKRVFIMGNGGSASTASHLALDLAKNTGVPGAPRLKALSLSENVPLLTALSNDIAFESVFSEQLATILEPDDVVIGISTSGNSLNVIRAFCLAKEFRAATIALLGAQGGQIKNMVDCYVLVPGRTIEQEEDAHLVLAHVITRHMRQVVREYVRDVTASSQI